MSRTKTVLVTGGRGFIGTHVCHELALKGYEPLVFDRHAVETDVHMVLGDIRDAVAVTEAVAHVDGVIHLAGVLGTQETISNPRPAAETNILGGLNVLEACAQYDVPLVNIAVGNWFENNPYSITKSSVERFADMYGTYRGLKVNSVRALNAYGPGQSVAQPYGSSTVRKIMPSFIMRALHNHPIEIYGDGNQVMDMVYVRDVARVLVQALGFTEYYGYEVGHVFEAGTGVRTTVKDIANAVIKAIPESSSEIVHLPMRPGETPGVEVLGDPATLRLLMGLGRNGPGFVELEEGVANTVPYFRSLLG